MYRNLIWCIILLFPLLSKGQDSPVNYKAIEAKVKKYIASQPDSTKIIIDQVLSQKNLHDSIRGNFYNIYGIYYSFMSKTDSALYYYKKSLSLLKKYPKIKCRTLTNISVIYRDRGEYDESFRHLEEALEITKKLKLRVGEAVIYSNMSSNYQYMLQYDKAVEYALKGIKIFEEEKETGQLAALNQKLANTYMKMRNFHFAKDLYSDCLKIFKANNDIGNHAGTLVNYAECLIHLNEYDKAINALNKALAELRIIKNSEHIAVAYSKLANIAKLRKRYDSAIKNYDAAFTILSQANSINSIIVAAEYIQLLNSLKKYSAALPVIEKTRKLPVFNNTNQEDKKAFNIAAAETYSNTNKNQEAINSLVNAIKLKDSLSKINDETYTKELQARFQTELQAEKNLALEANNRALQRKADAEKRLNLLYVLISIIIIVMILLAIRAYRLKNRIQEQELKSAAAENHFIKQKQQHEQQLIAAQKEAIDEKQRELTSMALRMANFQDDLNKILEKSDANVFTKVNDVKKELQLVMKRKDYWKQFEKRFNQLHPNFNHNLTTRFSRLTKNDLEFCSLLKLNLSNKEIASLLQISPESAITKKYRIKKKMEINDDAEFENLLMEI